jgi:DnaJ-class molecular chaperone
MNLNSSQVESIDRIRDFLKKTYKSDLLDRMKCRKCQGTGLSVFDGVGWDGSSFCDTCKGIGYLDSKNIDYTLCKCSFCNGEGVVEERGYIRKMRCNHCNGFGYINWIENLFGKKTE